MFNLPDKEKEILAFWGKEQIFQKSLEANKGKKPFVFYEGPPTANGKPGLHHVLARAYKDIILRFKTMQGFFVERKAGWDTHGLPVELEVEKKLGLNSKKDIETYGIEAFVRKAKESVWQYKQEWEELTKRMAFWLDLEHPYITYETPYIESLWFIIKTWWEKKLLEQDFKVVPWCYRCGTPLSSHELAQGYKKVTEPSFYVKFKLKPGQKISDWTTTDKTFILAWTTTSWTLPGNVALAVGENIEYGEVTTSKGESIVIATATYDGLIQKIGLTGSIARPGWQGKDLENLTYEPLFDIPELQSDKSYKIYAADFVSTQDGSGVVHTAVMYGEDDYRLGQIVGLPKFHTVTPEGTFINSLPAGLAGLPVKSSETGQAIENYLQQKGLLFAVQDYTHDYPFCWRCKTPLLYYATKSWFVRVTKVKQELLVNNETINWLPDHLKHGRFGNFLDEVKDWAFSRERYWGTPLPIWQCEQCQAYEVVGSLEELAQRSKARNTFILLRHGQAQNNLTQILSSLPQTRAYGLTHSGKEQAQNLAHLLQNEHVDTIITSPLARTKETARIIGDILKVSVVEDERLREVDMGPFNGKTLADFKKFWGSKQARFTKQGLPGMENFHQVKIRAMQCLLELNKTHEGQTILIVTHGGPLWLLEGTLRGLSEQEIAATFPEDFESGEARRVFVKFPFNRQGEVDLHRPYIDEIQLRCTTCKNGLARRVPEVADVWFDSGAMPFAQAHWPFAFAATSYQQPTTNNSRKLSVVSRKLGKLAFPADYICEAVDQTRGWFYSLLVVATVLGFEAPYKNVISLGHLLDEKGRKMSKSLGNIVDPFQAADTYGMDTIRWYFYVVNPPGFYKRLDPKEILSHQRRFLLTLFNCAQFFALYKPTSQKKSKARSAKPSPKSFTHALDRWILSRLNETVREVTRLLNEYNVTQSSRLLEAFVDDFSNWYIRLSRARAQREHVVSVLAIVLQTMSKLVAPFIPFSAEILYKDYLGEPGKAKSIHLEPWPQAHEAFINPSLNASMQKARAHAALVLALRAQAKIKVRQPLHRLTINEELPKDILSLIQQEVNIVQAIVVDTALAQDVLDTTLTSELLYEGFARELIRQGQDLRKQAGLTPGQHALLSIQGDANVLERLVKDKKITQRLSATIKFAKEGDMEADATQKKLNFEGKEITIWLSSNA